MMATVRKLRTARLYPGDGSGRNYWDTPEFPRVGEVVYVVEVERLAGAYNDRTGRGEHYWLLSRQIPRTNRGAERETGWLGTTDNVFRQALGRYRVVGANSTHTHFEPVTGGAE